MRQIENYQKDKLTINVVKVNIYAILMLIPIVVIYGLLYYLIWHNDFSFANSKNFMHDLNSEIIGDLLLIFMVLILGIAAHELIHGITWARFAEKGFKSIKFGVLWKMLTPYCHCKEPLLVKHYIMGTIMPGIILGFIPSILAIIIGHFGLFVFGLFFTVAAGGDFMMINILRKESMNNFVQDHPTKVGCYIYRPLNETK